MNIWSAIKKQKGITLKASKDEKEEKNVSDEDLALFVKRFKKVMKFGKKDFESKGQFLKKKGPFKKFEPRQEKTERKGVRCYECGGIGHFAPECANHNDKKKGKVMAATWSGSSDDSIEGEDSSDDEVANFIAFVSSYKSKSGSEKEEESQEENDSSGDDSSTHSTCSYVERSVLVEHYAEFRSLEV